MTPEEIELLSELTVVIPTYNRALELRRSIEYWKNTPVTLIVIDGSEAPNIWCSRNPNITYHHRFMKDTNPMLGLGARIVFGSSLSKTKYSVVCGDDDFLTITGLIQSLRILNSRPEINAVSGHILTYARKGRNLVWYYKYRPKRSFTLLESDSISEKLLTKKTWFLTAVCRTDIWIKFLNLSYEEKQFSRVHHHANEWIMFKLSKAMFNSRNLEMVTHIRQDTIVGWNKEPDTSWRDFICDPKNTNHVDDISRQLAKGFNSVTGSIHEDKNLLLAREQIRIEIETIPTQRVPELRIAILRRVLGNLLFVLTPGLSIYSDRSRGLKYFLRDKGNSLSTEQKSEIQKIESLLLSSEEDLTAMEINGTK